MKKPPSVLIAVRLPAPLLDKVDELVGRECVTRAEAVRRLLQHAAKQSREAEAA